MIFWIFVRGRNIDKLRAKDFIFGARRIRKDRKTLIWVKALNKFGFFREKVWDMLFFPNYYNMLSFLKIPVKDISN